jgi:subfamily B ATP-binding cassette protein HlyB/CyaB
VIIVTHRLSMLADAEAILVIDRGRIVDIGGHKQLLQRCTSYGQLMNQQTRQVA